MTVLIIIMSVIMYILIGMFTFHYFYQYDLRKDGNIQDAGFYRFCGFIWPITVVISIITMLVIGMHKPFIMVNDGIKNLAKMAPK